MSSLKEGIRKGEGKEQRQSWLCSSSIKRYRTELAWGIWKDWKSAESHIGQWELHVIYTIVRPNIAKGETRFDQNGNLS